MLELAFGIMENFMDKHSQFNYVIWRSGLFTAYSCAYLMFFLVVGGYTSFGGVLNMSVCVFMWACACV